MKTLTLALSLLLPFSAFAAEGGKREAKPRLEIDVPQYQLASKVFYLPSGLTVVFQADHSHPIVSIMQIIDHGSGDDPKGAEGTAHFAEHAWFRSTQTVRDGYDENLEPVMRTLPSIMDSLQDYGTLMNATTRNDWTDYRTVFAAKDLDLFLQLESKRLLTPYVGVKAEHIETEREVIRNEWRRRNEQGNSALFDSIYSTVYPEGHPYASSSTKESLGNVNLEVLQKYFDDYYKAENATIAVVGDFNIDEAASLIFENFDPKVIDPALEAKHIFRYPAPGVTDPDPTNADDWWFGAYDPIAYDPELPPEKRTPYRFMQPDNPDDAAKILARVRVNPEERAPEPPPPGTRDVVYKEAAIDNTTVVVAWSLPGGFRKDHQALQMIGNIANIAMFQYFNDINFEYNLEEWKRSDLGDRGCFTQAERINSTVMCLVELKNPKLNPEQIAEKIIDQMPFIWNPDLVQSLERQSFPTARNERLVGILTSIDNVAQHFGGRAEDIVTYAHFTGSPAYHSEAMAQTMELNALEMASMAQQYMTRKRAATVIIKPLPKEQIEKTGEGSTWAGASDSDAVLEGGDWLSKITNEDIEKAYVAPDMSKLVDRKLPNGMRVIALPQGEAPVARTSLVLGGGRATGEKSANTFARTFSGSDGINYQDVNPLSIAGSYNNSAYKDHLVLEMTHAAGNVGQAMWMLREEIAELEPDLRGKGEFVKAQQDIIKARWGGKRPGWLIAERTNQHLYGDDPRYQSMSLEDYERWNDWGANEVKANIRDHMQPANATVVITGAIDPEAAFASAEKYFGGWEPMTDATTDIAALKKIDAPEVRADAAILVFDSPERTQTQLSARCRINYDDFEDLPTLNVLSSLIGNETFTRLRVKEGLAYSPGGFATPGNQGVPFAGFSSLAVNDGVGRSIEVMREIVTKAENGEFPDELIKMHKLREARNGGIAAQSTGQIGARLEGMAVRDAGAEDISDVGNHIAAVSSESVQQMIDGCSENLLFTLDGPVDVITPQLDEKGFEYEVVDYRSEGETRFKAADPKGFKKYLKKKAKAAKKKAKKAGEAE